MDEVVAIDSHGSTWAHRGRIHHTDGRYWMVVLTLAVFPLDCPLAVSVTVTALAPRGASDLNLSKRTGRIGGHGLIHAHRIAVIQRE